MKKTYIILVLIILTVYSCTERIDFELKEGDNNSLVVDGEFTDEFKIHSVRLTRSTQYYHNGATPIELGATVTISGGSDIYSLTDNNSDGIYETETEVAGVPGNTYVLDITLADGSNYSATEFMVPLGDIDTITYKYEDLSFQTFKKVFLYKICMSFQEPSPKGNYYSYDLYIDNKLDTDSLYEKIMLDDEYYDRTYFDEQEMFVINNDSITKDLTPVKIEMKSLSKEHYDYNNSILMETVYRGSMFDGPPANVPTNISNGGLGFFAVSAVKEAETEIVYQTNPE